jgi:hypothetical protein
VINPILYLDLISWTADTLSCFLMSSLRSLSRGAHPLTPLRNRVSAALCDFTLVLSLPRFHFHKAMMVQLLLYKILYVCHSEFFKFLLIVSHIPWNLFFSKSGSASIFYSHPR